MPNRVVFGDIQRLLQPLKSFRLRGGHLSACRCSEFLAAKLQDYNDFRSNIS
jgi:hypothetical protein